MHTFQAILGFFGAFAWIVMAIIWSRKAPSRGWAAFAAVLVAWWSFSSAIEALALAQTPA